MGLFYVGATALMKLLLIGLTRWRVEGKENVPRHGPLIVVSNHLSLIDPPLLGASIPRRITFMAKEELFESTFSRMVVEGYGAFPVRRGRLDKQALRSAWDILDAQGVLGMFPEGKRSGDGHMLEAEDGAARIASHKGTQLLPVGIVGSNQVKGVSVAVQRPCVTVIIGRPFSLPLDDHRPRRERLQEHTSLIVQRIAELLPASHQPKTVGTLALSDAD
jgi:1-acyl-sn-glycerol-3-phosphate acyltransferase